MIPRKAERSENMKPDWTSRIISIIAIVIGIASIAMNMMRIALLAS